MAMIRGIMPSKVSLISVDTCTVQKGSGMRTVLIVAVLMFLAGCATYNTQKYSEIDTTNKTIKVPIGGDGLLGKLKKGLSESGWKFVTSKGPTITEGTLGEKVRLEQYDSSIARYDLHVKADRIDYCIADLSPLYRYSISVVDTRTGSEAFTLEGRGCESEIAKKFIELMSQS